MKSFLKTFAIVALAAGVSHTAMAAPAAPKPAAAAPTATGGVNGIAVANFDAVVVNSLAFKTAQAQREVTYKAQIDQAKAREAALNAQLKGLIDKFVKDRQAGVAAPLLQAQATQIQQLKEQGQAELQKIIEPVTLSEAYVIEQIMDKRDAAIQAAMTKSGVTLLLGPDAVVASTGAYNLNQLILNELNALVPSAQLVPPAGWVPRAVREQGGAPAPAPAPAAGGEAGR
ncbi:OmpH family outer membrane protein [Novosphingobium sp. FSY-8]|uniref:OmpH family outer membrane protein n=1 Tax=Novosphingobium ovatum TaxID=1908523 RepID=A0ABW9XHI0_9SPHN|nr:OmpH family outer membrane protein [Novosphingobium ovatum]NBC38017.1 OmpH family outer membrane protein [Novosphingobium ovatum]